MKNLFRLTLIITFIYTTQLFSATLSDNFESGKNGWQNSGTSIVTHDGSKMLRLNNNNQERRKDYEFGNSEANKDVTIQLKMCGGTDWESTGGARDLFRVKTFGNTLYSGYPGNNNFCTILNLTSKTNANGRLRLKIYQNVTDLPNEHAYIDNVVITTVASVISCTPLRDSKNLTALDNTYTNASHYNSNSWNVGSGASAMNRGYYFSVNSKGTVDIDLSRVDQNQAKFSVSKDNCPSSEDGLSSSQLIFPSAGTFYVYIYYVSGSHNNIEHQLDVVFTPDAPPTIPTPQSFSISIDDPDGTEVGTVIATGSPTSYSIDASSSDKFSIDSNGIITITGSLNLLEVTYTVAVTATNAEGSDTQNISITVNPASTNFQTGLQPFNIVNTGVQNIVGTYTIAGNTVMCLTENSTGYAGTCQDGASSALLTSNGSVSQYIDIDSDARTWNSTSSYVTLPNEYDPARGIAWAGLFWQGRISTDDDNPLRFGRENGASFTYDQTGSTNTGYSLNIQTSGANNIKLKINGGSYQDVLAREFFSRSSSGGTTYSAYSDVTNILKSASLGKGKQVFTVANLTTNEGRENSPGVFGGWSLVVIYLEDLLEGSARNVSIYHGFADIGSSDTPIPISGFKLPKLGDVKSQLSMFSGEGEFRYGRRTGNTASDWMKIHDIDTGDTDDYDNLPGAPNPNNMFDGILDGITRDNISGESNNLQTNNDGVDIDTYDVSDLMTSYRDSNENISEIFIQFFSDEDYVTPSMLAFSSELYIPQLCYDYSYEQDGFKYTEENNGSQSPNIDIPTNSGNPIDVTIYIKSLDSDVDFNHLSLYSDFNKSRVLYRPNSYLETQVNGYAYTLLPGEHLSASCTENNYVGTTICKTTGGDFRTGLGSSKTGYPLANAGRMSSGDFMYFKYSIDPVDIHPIYTPLNLYIDIEYELSDGSGTPLAPVYDTPLGDPRRMKLCPPSTVYQPEWGIFNVIDTNLNSTKTGALGSEYVNNLLTEVPKRAFRVDAVALAADIYPPTYAINPNDMNTSVALELVDIEGFHDVNISCQDPASAFSDMKHLYFNQINRVSSIQFDTDNAKRDAAYRIWYIHDEGNKSKLINNWIAHTNSNGDLQSIENLYEQINDTNGSCTFRCSDTTTTVCYNCVKEHFGYPLCSRDNFAIRPEAFRISVYDGNITRSFITENNNTNNFNVNLAAGYQNYSLDINSTNHLDSNSTIGYTQNFMPYDLDTYINATYLRNINATDCSNESNVSYAARVTNGRGWDISFDRDESSKYSIHVKDANFTAVDQGTPAHHISPYFIIDTDDCIANSNIVLDQNTTLAGLRVVGCNISSKHVVDRTVTLKAPLSYTDINVTFLPYEFELVDLIPSHGAGQDPVFSSPTYVYMSDLDIESNESVNFIGRIRAQGFTGTDLANYTNSCNAQDINITLNNNYLVDDLVDKNLTGISFYNDFNNSLNIMHNESNETNVTIIRSNFFSDINGTMSIRLHFNYDRNISNPIEPKQVSIQNLHVQCSRTADCTMYADQLDNYENNRSIVLNQTVNFLYARADAPRRRIEGNTGDAYIYYEVYTSIENRRTLLPNGVLSKINPAHINWYRNANHVTNDGSVRNPRQLVGTKVSTTIPTLTTPAVTTLTYDDSGSNSYPYKTTILYSAPEWLIYNRFDDNATSNEFDVEFINNQAGQWTGTINTDSHSDDQGSINTNRRINW